MTRKEQHWKMGYFDTSLRKGDEIGLRFWDLSMDRNDAVIWLKEPAVQVLIDHLQLWLDEKQNEELKNV